MKIFTLCFLLSFMTFGCISNEPLNVDTPDTRGTDESILEYIQRLSDAPISFKEEYDELLPIIIDDLLKCEMQGENIPERLTKYPQYVHAYAHDLTTREMEDADAVTIANDTYWQSVFALTAHDITALLVRLALLMREGRLREAEILLLFCAYDRNAAWDRDTKIINTVQNHLQTTYNKSEALIEEGIEYWDQGNRMKAKELYRDAMVVFPKSPWAIWELALDEMTHNPNNFLLTEEFESVYEMIRDFDPHYEMAWYQGKNSPRKVECVTALRDSILPSYHALRKGEDIEMNMRSLADGYMVIGEYEFALYAYKVLLFHFFTGDFDPQTVSSVKMCLEKLNVGSVIPFFEGLIYDIEKSAADIMK